MLPSGVTRLSTLGGVARYAPLRPDPAPILPPRHTVWTRNLGDVSSYRERLATAAYRERLAVPWWWWPTAPAFAALLAAEVYLGVPGLATWIPYVALLPAALATLWWLGRLQIAVADDEFLVDDARLPLRFVARVVALDRVAKRDLLGPGAHPQAFVVQRPWISGGVQVILNDPADPTPYWVVSSRRPKELAQALTADSERTGKAA